jgi:hypothetical protein
VSNAPSLVATGMGFNTPTQPFTGCRICGDIYENPDIESRKEWSRKHALEHSPLQHRMLMVSGQWCTPEAAIKLAAFGVVDLIGLSVPGEVQEAYSEKDTVLGASEKEGEKCHTTS